MPHVLVEKRSAVFQTANKMHALPTCNSDPFGSRKFSIAIFRSIV